MTEVLALINGMENDVLEQIALTCVRAVGWANMGMNPQVGEEIGCDWGEEAGDCPRRVLELFILSALNTFNDDVDNRILRAGVQLGLHNSSVIIVPHTCLKPMPACIEHMQSLCSLLKRC